ncbi:nitrogenase cofactor biosynthesis protein NifB [Thermincola potens]|uniref:FeMo cofactor biosynthesis protein NifB n=1 Tax=Thermincola potens (strain JR) TaxID=635013 RepID=D5XC16_THEPJ|nr:nitrogenase cofactor biosynthesis protein NifB [Thermincola potens]ADG81564.1 nitrogenase cofactor biosynthesis protein NifB [Thermincola potens JR]
MECSSPCSVNNKHIPPGLLEATAKHPCYSFGAHHKYARMHLPVAPKCNINCNYCNRKFDCLHESRPGVTSEILTPQSAEQKFRRVKAQIENLSVVGIAGPGDALANWETTKESIERVKAIDPEIIFCLSTNGLLLPEYYHEIISLGIKHVTVTVNCLNPEIGARIYGHILYKGKRYEGETGAAILIKNQLEGIRLLAENGVLVKVNIVMIKDINDFHIPDIVKKVKELGAFMTNIMPLIPAPGSAFENYQQTSMKELNKMRNQCQLHLHQMHHCRQCRADAIGLLGDDRAIEFAAETAGRIPAGTASGQGKKIYRIAVASKRGDLIDQHFGHASEFLIYDGNGRYFEMVETRRVDKYCSGAELCETEEDKKDAIADALKDCNAVLILRIGYQARQRLLKKGIVSIEHYGTVEEGLSFAVQKIEGKEAV